jgi:hypothetical protein
MSTKDIDVRELTRRKYDEVVQAFKDAGFVGSGCFCRGNEMLTLPGKSAETYLGTYLNPYTTDDEEGLWCDEVARERPMVEVEVVYRHNGTAEDVSVRAKVYHAHSRIRPFPEKWTRDREDPAYVAKVRAGSPFNYLEEKNPFCESTVFEDVGAFKVRNTSGERALRNMVAKAKTACEAFVPVDHSEWARDRKDYHADNRKEFFERAEREKAKASA